MFFNRDLLLKILYRSLTVILIAIWAVFIAFAGYFSLMKRMYPLKYKEEIMKYSSYYGIEECLIFSFVKVESDFDEKAVSNKGAIGLMQITPKTGEYIAKLNGARNYDLTNPETNINFGCYYLGYLLDKFKNIETTICAYNAGEGNVSEWLKNPEYSDDGERLKSVPFSETREYIKKIKKTFEKYKKLYGNILDKRQKFE